MRNGFTLLSKNRTEMYGVSIFVIMMFHAYLVKVEWFTGIPLLHYIQKITKYGNMGVEVFLILSGISLYFAWQKSQDVGLFLKKRMLRIYPTLYLGAGVYWVFRMVKGEMNLTTFLANMTGIRFWYNGTTQVWFISTIIALYLLFPYFISFIFPKKEKKYQAEIRTLILAAFFVLLAFLIKKDAPDYYKLIEIGLTRFPAFIVGIYLGKMVYEKKAMPAAVIVLSVILVVVCYIVLEKRLVTGIYKRYWYLTGGVGITLILPFLINKTPDILKKLMRFFGNMSLELYICHIAALQLYQKGNLPYQLCEGSYKRYVLTMIISVVWAWLILKARIYLLKGIDNLTNKNNRRNGDAVENECK